MKPNALIAGSTGLVGGELAKLLTSNGYYGSVHLPVRKIPGAGTLPAKYQIIDYSAIHDFEVHEPVRDVYICLGTTQKKAGGRAGFYLVDHDYTLNLATWALQHGAERICLISSIGANPRSASFYLKTKGRIEQDIISLGFEHTCIIRPSLLLGKRSEYRWAEEVAAKIYPALSFMLVGKLKKYRAVKARQVALAMFHFLTTMTEPLLIAESDKISDIEHT